MCTPKPPLKPPNADCTAEQGSRLGLDFTPLDVCFIQLTLFPLKLNFKDAFFWKTFPAFIPHFPWVWLPPMLILTHAQGHTVLIGFACVDTLFWKPSSVTLIHTGFSHPNNHKLSSSMLVTHQVVMKTATPCRVYRHEGRRSFREWWAGGNQQSPRL